MITTIFLIIVKSQENLKHCEYLLKDYYKIRNI